MTAKIIDLGLTKAVNEAGSQSVISVPGMFAGTPVRGTRGRYSIRSILAWRDALDNAHRANGGRLEHAQQMAAHESPRTTKLYDRTKDEITCGEVERIQL